eukprot:scaffold41481_cov517-Isochrysis_galbana.AAC.1
MAQMGAQACGHRERGRRDADDGGQGRTRGVFERCAWADSVGRGQATAQEDAIGGGISNEAAPPQQAARSLGSTSEPKKGGCRGEGALG